MGITGMGEASSPVRIFFDAECARCLRWAKKMAKKDPAGKRIVFRPLQGDEFKAAISEDVRTSLPDALVAVGQDGKIRTGMGAVLLAANCIGGPVAFFASFFGLLPSAWSAWVYSAIARNRHRGEGHCGDEHRMDL